MNFRTDKQIPTVHQAKMGRPQADERTDSFLEVASFLEESDEEQITINDLINRMEHNLANSEHEVYSYLLMKLHEHFGSSIMQTKLRLQYMEMVDILRMLIRADLTGIWGLHLRAVSEMLPYMAASGHNMYTKSARMYLQRMSNFQDEFPDVHQTSRTACMRDKTVIGRTHCTRDPQGKEPFQ